MSELLTALALMLAVEGLCFAAFPGAMRRAMRDAAEMPERLLRILGFAAALLGVLLVWMRRGFPAFNLL
jgi:uncharacterized protein YjeT (DUF2065 family)